MVVLQNVPPLIQNDRGIALAFESEWLKAAVDRAARRAGYDGWCLLDEFSASVSQFFHQDYSQSTIELPQLDRVVRATLRDIGYREIAVRFRTVNPFQRISLADSLKTAGGKNGASFFRRLAQRIEVAHAAQVRRFDFYDLQPCVQKLLAESGAPSWWGESLLQACIVSFVRERVSLFPWPGRMQCTIR